MEMDHVYMWICQETKDKEEDYLIEIKVNVQEDAFIAKNKDIGNFNVHNL